MSDMSDMIYRETARRIIDSPRSRDQMLAVLAGVPSAQIERDIPVYPTATTDRTWGIVSKQPVCPKCDYYLGHVEFLGDGNGKRITYCEHCGQAIDWEGWDEDEQTD